MLLDSIWLNMFMLYLDPIEIDSIDDCRFHTFHVIERRRISVDE